MNPLSLEEDLHIYGSPLPWPELAEQLLRNLRGFIERGNQDKSHLKYPPYSVPLLETICKEFCRSLYDWDLSAPYDPAYPDCPDPSPRVRFDAFIGDQKGLFQDGLGNLVEKEALTRRLKLRWSLEAAKDLQACYYDPNEEFGKTLGQEAAVTIQMELRCALRETDKKVVCAIHLPPFTMPSLLPEGFSSHSVFGIQYATWPLEK